MAEFSGHLFLEAAKRDTGETALTRQSFRAPFHLSKPYWDGHALLVQVVNPTAGILAGDRLQSEVAIGSGAAVLLTSPSASRVFKMGCGEATFSQRFHVAAKGWLEVMPEPLVLHGGSRFRQSTEIEIEADGELFYVDLLMPGRLASGEVWAWDTLKMELTLKVDGEWLLRERLDQSGEALKALAGGGDGVCFANIVMVSPRLRVPGEWKTRLAALHGGGVWAGVSELHGGRGGWSLKLIAADNLTLRRVLRTVRQIMQEMLPRLACDPRKL